MKEKKVKTQSELRYFLYEYQVKFSKLTALKKHLPPPDQLLKHTNSQILPSKTSTTMTM